MADEWHPMRWAVYALAAMFVLIGVSIFLGVLFFRIWPGPSFGWGWIWNLFGLLVFLWILSWIFGWGWGWRRYRHRSWHDDDAYDILRNRYARGELSRDQYEQMMGDLKKHDMA